MKQKNIDTIKLTSFNKTSIDQLEEKYHFLKKTGYDFKGFVAEANEIFVHTGNVSLKGDYFVGDQSCGIYVIDGNLTIDGSFRHCIGDYYQIIYVTGDVHARNLTIDTDAAFFVGGSVHVDGYLYTNLSNAGALFVGGETTAKTMICLNRMSPTLTNAPNAQLILVSDNVKGGNNKSLKDAKLASEHIDEDTLELEFGKFYELIRTGKLKIQ